MSDGYIWAVIAGMAVMNLAERLAPIAVTSRLRLPKPVERWLSFIPVSVMAALVAGEVLHPSGEWLAPWANPYLWAAVPTGLVYWKTRSFLGSVLVGLVLFLLFRAALG